MLSLNLIWNNLKQLRCDLIKVNNAKIDKTIHSKFSAKCHKKLLTDRI